MNRPQTVLVRAARVHVLSGPEADTLAVRGGTIVAAGAWHDLRASHPLAAVVDRRPHTIVPGFVDAHHHVTMAAVADTGVDLRIPAVSSLEEIRARIAACAQHLPSGAWILARGYRSPLPREGRGPRATDLDGFDDHPILLVHEAGHEAVANRLALSRLPNGGRDVLTGEDYARLEAMAVHDRLTRAREDCVQRLLVREQQLFAAGITHLADPTVTPGLFDMLRAARRAGLRIGITPMPCSAHGKLVPPWDRMGEGPRTGDTAGTDTVGPLKLFLDGAEHCDMCLGIRDGLRVAIQVLRNREAGPPPVNPRLHRRGLRVGIARMDGDELPRMAEVASREGYGLAMHAVGNLAVDRALDAFEHAERVGTAPPRIEHGLLVSRDQLARTADAGVAIVTQPLFLEQPGMRKVPRRASFSALPLRTALAEGVLLAGSSDAPVSDFDVFRGMEMAVERRMPDGSVHDPHERIDRRQALQLYTTHAAAVCGVEDRGHLGEGARADFVVLDADPLSTRNVLTHIDVLETWLGGEQVWTRTLQPAR